jgi:anthranilate synthase component 1
MRTPDAGHTLAKTPATGAASYEADPLDVPRRITRSLKLLRPPDVRGQSLPRCFLGGWVGYAGYDTVRYAEPEKLDPAKAPRDDRGLPDLDLAYYDGVVVFDHVDKLVHVIRLVEAAPGASESELSAAYDHAAGALESRVRELQMHSKPLASGRMGGGAPTPAPMASNLTRTEHAKMVARAMEYIRAGDIFQVVLGQRFERKSVADPFDVYRALRAVNPSPYMVYMQNAGCILVASSPEILCRVRATTGADGKAARIVTNRPLAGTRKRGATSDEDRALERDLLADPKEVAEHSMLVDLGRNDVGRVAVPGTISIPARLAIERYSHVMHISSTVTGELREGLDCWDALRAALPVGTISGAPKIRAMQIIDELEPVRRGPYGGGMGYVGLDGDMDIALALRTMVVPTAMRTPAGEWTYHIQAAGGIVADSQAEAEYQETVNKAAALGRAIEVAEKAFKEPLA